MSTIKNAVLWGLVLAGLLAGGSASATNFAILLSGSSVDGSNTTLDDCDGVVMEDLTFDSREMTTGLDVEYRHYQPGKPIYGNITFEAAQGSGASKELQAWWQESAKGYYKSRTGNVIILDDKREEAMRYTFLDCFLTSYSVVEEQNADGSVRVIEEYEVKPNGVQMYKAKQGKSGKANPGKMSIIEDDGSTSTDDTVEGWSGGEPALIITSPFRNSRFHTETPGNKLVTDISLDLPDDGPSQVICDWVNAAVQGKPWKKSMSMVDLSPKGRPVGKMYHYHECFPTRYVFPVLIKGSTVEAGPTLTIKAARVNIN